MAWLRLLGVQLYVYFDNLLVMGESKEEVAQSVQKTIQVLIQVGFVVNLKKSKLAPTQDFMYIVVRFWTDLGKLYLLELRIQMLITCVGSFSNVWAYKPAHQFLRLLGLMAATWQLHCNRWSMPTSTCIPSSGI